MRKNIFITSITFLLLLSSCGSTQTDIWTGTGTGSIAKTPFIVKTINLSDNSGTIQVEKSWRITASSSLTLTSQWAGEIGKIFVKEWQRIKAGTTIAVLKDTVNNFDLRLAQAENTLKVQEANIETTKINLEQAVQNARIAYERAKKSLETLTAKNGIIEATLMNTNSKTLDTYNVNYKSYLSDIEKNMTMMIYEWDKILGMSNTFELANDSWEPYLGTRSGNSVADAKNDWNRTYSVRGDIRAKLEKGGNIETTDPIKDLELISAAIIQTRKYTDSMIYMIQNNTVGAGLSQDLQNGWTTAWNGYRSQIGLSETTYNSWKGNALTFLKSYKNTELGTRLAVISLGRDLTSEEQSSLSANTEAKLAFDTNRITLKDQIDNAKLSLEQADKAYKTSVELRDATLDQLDANKRNSEIALDQARRDYSKLTISAPIEWNITKVIANVWQAVNIWSAVAEFSGKLPQVVIDIDSDLASTLITGDTVIISTEWKTLTGIITAVSNISNSNLLSTVRMSIQNGEKYIGKTATIIFQSREKIHSDTFLLPINSVKIISEEEGEVYIISGTGTLSKKVVKLWKVWDTNIEVIGNFDKKDKIITSDMSNYDENKNTVVVE